MPFALLFTAEADGQMDKLEENPALAKRRKAVNKALAFLEHNPRHPGLNTHKFGALKGPNDEDVFEAYAENNSPGAYRIFWCYGPGKDVITVLAITPHP
jgi:hypothetical protein